MDGQARLICLSRGQRAGEPAWVARSSLSRWISRVRACCKAAAGPWLTTQRRSEEAQREKDLWRIEAGARPQLSAASNRALRAMKAGSCTHGTALPCGRRVLTTILHACCMLLPSTHASFRARNGKGVRCERRAYSFLQVDLRLATSSPA